MNKLILTLLLLFGLTQAYAVDTLRQHSSEKQEETYWYAPIISFFGQRVPETKGRDLIIINDDRSLIYNGQRLRLMDSIDSWVKVIGVPSRISKYGGYSWDDKGISISTKNKGIAKTINIQFLSYREIFPEKTYNNFEGEGKGGVLISSFKGIIKIEDGYLAREINRDEFKKSDVWKKFKKRAFANSYSSTYEDEVAIQFNVVTFTHDGQMKRVSMYSSL
ncbi:hypothetical protein JHD50_04165 [Sulfurimonas sp. MAG313]|nr:hypothetical protein [Sulfurimonas sp. MAG313]MDF1880506.1 hypothetical protein [Sulfurimonas sp. MAG313]